MSNFIESVLLRLRRQETPFLKKVFMFAKKSLRWNLPLPRVIGHFLYYERLARRKSWKNIMSRLYYHPMFVSRCESVGKGLVLENSIQGIPLIAGDLRMIIGNYVRINDIVTFAGLKVKDAPKLVIGDYTRISDRVSIFVAQEVRIGKNCIISSSLIIDNPSHPIDPVRRRNDETFQSSAISPVIIEDDTWLARNSIILRGVTIGRGAIVAAGAVVTKDVAPYTIVAGNPARQVGQTTPGTIGQDTADYAVG